MKHHSLRLYFTHFDKAIGRFMPTEDLAFRYPYDGPYNSFDSRKRNAAAVLNRGSAEQQLHHQQHQQQQQQQQLLQQQQQGPGPEQTVNDHMAASAAAKSVLRSVSGLGVRMADILARHLRHHTELSSLASSSSTSAAAAASVAAATASASTTATTTTTSALASDPDSSKVKQMVHDIMGDIILLVDRCQRCNNDHTVTSGYDSSTGTATATGTTTGSSTGSSTVSSTGSGSSSGNSADRFVVWRAGAEQRMLLGIDPTAGQEALPGMWSQKGLGSGSGLGAGEGKGGGGEAGRLEERRAKEEAKAVDALDSLMACFKGNQ